MPVQIPSNVTVVSFTHDGQIQPAQPLGLMETWFRMEIHNGWFAIVVKKPNVLNSSWLYLDHDSDEIFLGDCNMNEIMHPVEKYTDEEKLTQAIALAKKRASSILIELATSLETASIKEM
jgi:hypothetical protein